jgi:hypothetical protein
MLIALDFDKTFLLDPSLWAAFLRVASANGHRAIMVTCRSPRDDNRELIREALMTHLAADYIEKVICTGHHPKRAAAEASGFKVDVWIDDVPEVIGARDMHEVLEIEGRFHVPTT